MSTLPKPEEFLKYVHHIWDDDFYSESAVIKFMKEYGRQVRDKTLEWAAENAKMEPGSYSNEDWYISRTSILNGKTSKDLEI